ncbi:MULTISPECIES: hypothetical protein [unclassified Rathayibacter]|uniref:hypothetical protein n=1 Tax=unclassified Rathayibacter TaxID=2609250 RepID=UPI00188A1C89|nr:MULTISPECIES: hypothetical protein [unclassified Rathayibacter]MBF4462277.1 hypothetical protein [Rathayibacter sp. VKM Ac-2879]MBF4503680.1 hypothetical protein [Rathayibacter sp. VKM Ac-2878]
MNHPNVAMRRTPPSDATIAEMVRLYESALSLQRVGERVNANAATVRKYIGGNALRGDANQGRASLSLPAAHPGVELRRPVNEGFDNPALELNGLHRFVGFVGDDEGSRSDVEVRAEVTALPPRIASLAAG